MANVTIGKVIRGLNNLYRKKEYFETETKKMLCSTLLQSFFDYGNNVWYHGLCKQLKTKLQTCQNKMIRYVLNLQPRAHLTF